MSRILIVDDDPVILAAASGILARSGHETVTASNGMEGLKLAAEQPPDLVITDVNMPTMDGWEFVRQLRSTREHAWTPVFFLTDHATRADRVRGFNLGADDYLQKPIPFEELHLRVARALQSRDQLRSNISAPPSGGVDSTPGIRGELDQVGLATLLTMFDMERRSGELALQSRNDRRGQLLIREGRVVYAIVYGDFAMTDADAVFELLNWNTGHFTFRAFTVTNEDTIDRPVGALLLESARRSDESRT